MSNEKTFMDYINEAKSRITEVDIDTAEHLISKGHKVLDIREPDEYLNKRIKGSINIPRGVLEPAACSDFTGANPELRDNRDENWLILCATGGRAALAADTLQMMGFNNVASIAGGIDAWHNASKETLKDSI
jgi:rhodanese-related sulfurtransferase